MDTKLKDFEERCKKCREFFFSANDHVFQQNNDLFLQNINSDQNAPFQYFQIKDKCKPETFFPYSIRTLIENNEDENIKYKIEFEVGDFKNNELTVNLNENNLLIRGDHEIVIGNATERKSLERHISLPSFIDLSKLNSYLIERKPYKNEILSSNFQKNILVVEAPIINEKYSYRVSKLDKSYIPIKSEPKGEEDDNIKIQIEKDKSFLSENSEKKNLNQKNNVSETYQEHFNKLENIQYESIKNDIFNEFDYNINKNKLNNKTSESKKNIMKSDIKNPELIKGYPIYDNNEGFLQYKFDFNGFDKSEIQLYITNDFTLEIKARKEEKDNMGKICRLFKREIYLDPDIDINLIRNYLDEGVLTLKIPAKKKQDSINKLTDTPNLISNGFFESFDKNGNLNKLCLNFKGYDPQNIRVILSKNKILKIFAKHFEESNNKKQISQRHGQRLKIDLEDKK